LYSEEQKRVTSLSFYGIDTSGLLWKNGIFSWKWIVFSFMRRE